MEKSVPRKHARKRLGKLKKKPAGKNGYPFRDGNIQAGVKKAAEKSRS
jgi:hypothetical protein